MSNTSYRPEIDGLRAVAVMGVVFFHAGLGFPGGFVGVDVFFVISGYLITGLIYKKLESNSFSLLDFWAKRIRRILPAVAVVVFAVIFFGLYLLDPQALSALAKSSTYQSVMLANVYFWKNTGYFTGGADHTPLLHTWTLAVEEQFYVFFPILLIAVYRYFHKRMFLILLLGAVASFGVSVYFTPIYPGGSFFLLPPRAWELLAGSLLAVSKSRRASKSVSELISVVGIGMIGFAMFVYDKNMEFPGYFAAMPVIGAVMFIYSCNLNVTLVGKILSLKYFVFIGLISYSLYLWHWPLLSFAHILFGHLGMMAAWFIVTISIGLSYLSWRFIENPCRRMRPGLPRTHVISSGLIVIVLLFTSSVYIVGSGGLPRRFDDNQLGVMKDISWYGAEYMSTSAKPILIGDQSKGSSEAALDFVLWGDSHAMAIGKLVDRLASKYGLAGQVYAVNAGIPVEGLSVVNIPEHDRVLAVERAEQILKHIMEDRVQNVILVSRWSAYYSGSGKGEIDAGEPWDKTLVSNSIKVREASLENAASSISQQLELMLAQLADAGVQVWLIKQVPEIANVNAAQQFYMAKRFPFLADYDEPDLTLLDHNIRQEGVNQMLSTISLSGARVIDPSPSFFDDTGAMRTTPGRSLYRNDDHLTANGAEFYLSDIFDTIMAKIEADSR